MSGSKDYEIGYGRPPRKTQFKPGVSGNPSGRSHRAKEEIDSLERILSRKIPFTEGGKTRLITYREALELKVLEKAPSLDAVKLLRLIEDIDRRIERNRVLFEQRRQELEDKEAEFGEYVRKCVDAFQILEAMVALDMALFEDGRLKVRPEALRTFAGSKLDTDDCEAIRTLRAHFFPGHSLDLTTL